MVLTNIPPGVKQTLQEALASGRAGDPRALRALLNDLRMRTVYRYLTARKFSDDQVNRFLSKAVTLAYPVKLKSPLFTLREIKRAPAKKRAIMEWHPVAPGSPHPAVTIYLAQLATIAKEVLGNYSYGTVATVASVVLKTKRDITEKQVRSALRIFTKPSAKVRLWRLPTLEK